MALLNVLNQKSSLFHSEKLEIVIESSDKSSEILSYVIRCAFRAEGNPVVLAFVAHTHCRTSFAPVAPQQRESNTHVLYMSASHTTWQQLYSPFSVR